jgi:hypothetical protein
LRAGWLSSIDRLEPDVMVLRSATISRSSVKFHPVAPWWGALISALTFVFVLAAGLLAAVLLSMNGGPAWESPQPGIGPALVFAAIDLIGLGVIVMTITPNIRLRYIEASQLGLIWSTGRNSGSVSWADIECIKVAKRSEPDDTCPPGAGRRSPLAWIIQRDGRVVPLPLNSGYPGARRHARHVARRLIESAPLDTRLRLRA